ncbi:MAG: T9SS type A sorting domain-containing protein [Flavobacteriales bacterium]|nr:T9SS type A sorting domain-containing protein [Flavobacteriales bacterium]
MRIRLTDSGAGPNTTPCGNSSYGEVEDYTLNVTAAAMPLFNDPQTIAEVGSRASEDTNASSKADLLLVYPNPTRGLCTIKASGPGTYYLMNEMGQLVRSFTLNAENENTIQLNDLSPGTYVVSGQSKSGVVKQKLIVQ